MKAYITDIKRFAVHDGDGIRTTVFFKECPLKCLWCHNPETISCKKQIALFTHKCLNCGICCALCECNRLNNGVHIFEREKCNLCGRCENVCPNDAFEIYGKEMSTDEILDIVLSDKKFYDESGGGVTLSGGECLLQADFCAELLKKIKDSGINTAVDTCGFVKRSALDKVMKYTDTFLYDIKAIDEKVHIKCTGRGNSLILDNLRYLSENNCRIEIRYPLVMGYNDSECDKVGAFLQKLRGITKIKVLQYHNLAASKYMALNMLNTLPEVKTTFEDVENAVEVLRKHGLAAVNGSVNE